MAGFRAHRPPPGGRSAIHFQGVTSGHSVREAQLHDRLTTTRRQKGESRAGAQESQRGPMKRFREASTRALLGSCFAFRR